MERKEIVNKLKKWLGKNGIQFFTEVKEKYGRINAFWLEEGEIPHAVHFREGMAVRNYLRTFLDWDAHKLDNEWVALVEEAIQ
jgi:hypothetical protein